jgi:hypothetical protein
VAVEDEDEDEEPPATPTIGRAEPAEIEPDEHPAGWLYLPDLSSSTGWSSHAVPIAERPRPRRVGFRSSA